MFAIGHVRTTAIIPVRHSSWFYQANKLKTWKSVLMSIDVFLHWRNGCCSGIIMFSHTFQEKRNYSLFLKFNREGWIIRVLQSYSIIMKCLIRRKIWLHHLLLYFQFSSHERWLSQEMRKKLQLKHIENSILFPKQSKAISQTSYVNYLPSFRQDQTSPGIFRKQ